MAWWLPWKRVSLASSAPVDELQHRLAAATAEWSERGWGSPVPPPPWQSGHFSAVQAAPYVSVVAVVVSGTVRPEGSGARLEATVRPHGSALFATGAFILFAGFGALDSGSVGRVILSLVALVAVLFLVGLARERIRPVEVLLRGVCR